MRAQAHVPHAAIRGHARGRAVTVAAATNRRDAGSRGGWGGVRRTRSVRTCAASAPYIPDFLQEKDENFCGADGTVRLHPPPKAHCIPLRRCAVAPRPCGTDRTGRGECLRAQLRASSSADALPLVWSTHSRTEGLRTPRCPQTPAPHWPIVPRHHHCAPCLGATRKTPPTALEQSASHQRGQNAARGR